MGILDAIASSLGYARKTARVRDVPAWMAHDAHFARWSMPDPGQFEAQGDLYRRLAWIQIAVSAVARTAAATQISVRRRVGDELRDITNHPLELLLEHPNPLDSRFELLETTFGFRALTGNAYWWLNRRDERSQPAEIWPIPPNQILPVPDGRQYLRGYAYFPEGISATGSITSPPYLLEPHEVVHFKSFNPLNRWIGLSPLEALALDAHGDLKQQEWNYNFFGEQNAKVPGMLAFADPIPDTDWSRMQEDVRRQTGGTRRNLMMLRNAGRGGVNWVPMAMSQKDMEFLAARDFTKEEIFATFAPGLASMLAINATEANSIAGKATFIEQAVWPLLVAGSEKVSNDVLTAYGRNLVASFDDIRVTDRQLQLAEIAEYSRYHTLDEVRAKYYQTPPIGDRRGTLLAGEISPVTAPAEALPEAGDPPPAPALPEPPRRPALPAPAEPEEAEAPATRAAVAIKRGAGEGLSDPETVLFDLLRPILEAYRQEIADAITASGTISYDALSRELRDALLSTAVAVALTALQDTSAVLGIDLDPDQVVTRASVWASQHAGEAVAGLTETTRRTVEQAVSLWAETPGMTRAQLEALLAPAFGAMRAEVIAITETTRAAAAGVEQLQAGLADAGVPMERVWRAVGDELVCPVCGPLNGQAEGAWPAQLAGGPPAHPRCRCSVTLQRRQG